MTWRRRGVSFSGSRVISLGGPVLLLDVIGPVEVSYWSRRRDRLASIRAFCQWA